MEKDKEGNEIKEGLERFFKLLEAGTLAYFDIIEYAFVLFGITKHGKTTLAHHLVNNPLKAYRSERQLIRYKLNTVKNSEAKINDSMNS